MPSTSLSDLEQRLEACLLDLEKTHRTRPGLSTALARAEAGQKIDRLYEEMVDLQQQIDAGPAETLQDAAVKLRRLSAYVEDARPMRLLAGALEAVERAAVRSPSSGRHRAMRLGRLLPGVEMLCGSGAEQEQLAFGDPGSGAG